MTDRIDDVAIWLMENLFDNDYDDEGYRYYIVRYDDTGRDILHVTSVTLETDTDKWCARAMEFERE